MPYPGGKSGSGIYQRIVNLMPPHQIYIEPFLGGAAIMRMKRPARVNVGIDLDPDVIDRASSELTTGHGGSRSAGNGVTRRSTSSDPTFPADPRSGIAGNDDSAGDSAIFGAAAGLLRLFPGDGIKYLKSLKPEPGILVYCDPPYMMSTRGGRRLYKYEMSDVDHRHLLRCCRSLGKAGVKIMISGYWSELYAKELHGWQSIHYEAMTRGGLATEWLWFNFTPPAVLHDYRYLGVNFRERQRIKRKKDRWTARLARMPLLERQALLCAIEESEAERAATRERPEL